MSSKETTYSEFLKQLEKNNVKTVEFSNYEMDYTLVDDKKPYEITYYTGIVNDPDLITTLKSAKTSEGKAIEISASVPDNTSAWLVNILSFVIPLVLIWILFWIPDAPDGRRSHGGWKINRQSICGENNRCDI